MKDGTTYSGRSDYRRYMSYDYVDIMHSCDHCGAVTKYREEPKEMKCGDPDCVSNNHRGAMGTLVVSNNNRKYLLIG